MGLEIMEKDALSMPCKGYIIRNMVNKKRYSYSHVSFKYGYKFIIISINNGCYIHPKDNS